MGEVIPVPRQVPSILTSPPNVCSELPMTFWGYGNDLYFGLSNAYMNINIYQNPSGHVLKSHACILYVN